jgi:hypothetical protein
MDTARFPGGSSDRGPATTRAADEAVQRIAAVDETIRQRYAARAFSSRDGALIALFYLPAGRISYDFRTSGEDVTAATA